MPEAVRDLGDRLAGLIVALTALNELPPWIGECRKLESIALSMKRPIRSLPSARRAIDPTSFSRWMDPTATIRPRIALTPRACPMRLS